MNQLINYLLEKELHNAKSIYDQFINVNNSRFDIL